MSPRAKAPAAYTTAAKVPAAYTTALRSIGVDNREVRRAGWCVECKQRRSRCECEPEAEELNFDVNDRRAGSVK